MFNVEFFRICIYFFLLDLFTIIKYICGIVYLSFRFYQFCFMFFKTVTWCIHILDFYILLRVWSFYHYEISLFISSNTLYLKPAFSLFKKFLLEYSFFNKFIYLFLAALGLAAACGLSLVAVSRVYSSLQCAGFSLWWLLLLWSTGSRHEGFSSCGMQAQ